MPRFVRPAWLEARADGRSTPVGLGPRRLGGWLEARLTLRTPDGEVSSPILLEAGGPRGVLILTLPDGFALEDFGSPGMYLIGQASLATTSEVPAQ